MIEEPELEEGETCYKDDTNMDPDKALSYIGDNVQRILGHFQKDFEGLVSAENLGAKYGEYGSFLPMYERCPTVLRPKSPKRVQNPHLPTPPNLVYPMGPAPNSIMPPPSKSASHILKSFAMDASNKQSVTFSCDKVGPSPVNDELPSSTSGNQPDQRSLKFRLKVGPRKGAKYNDEIYSLGLNSPSSSSEGNSHDENEEFPIEPCESFNESAAKIIQMMTSSPVSGAKRLSPLSDELLNLVTEAEKPASSTFPVRILKNNLFMGKKENMVEESKKIGKSNDEFLVDFNDNTEKMLSSNGNPEQSQPFDKFYGKVSNTVIESKKEVRVKNRRGGKDVGKGRVISGDLIKGTSLNPTFEQSCVMSKPAEPKCSSIEKVGEHGSRISEKHVSVDHLQCSKTQDNGNCASFKSCSNNSEVVKGSLENSCLTVGLSATSRGHNGFGMSHVASRLSLECDDKLKRTQNSENLALRAAGDLSNGGSAIPKNKHKEKKDVHRLRPSQKDVMHTSSEHTDNPKHLLERSAADKKKEFKTLGAAKSKAVVAVKLKEKSSNKKLIDKVILGTDVLNSASGTVHGKDRIFSGQEQTVAAPMLIEENWVCCDRCEKWRLLPYGMKSELPDKWVCSMLSWLPGMNRCDIPEDETTRAVQSSHPDAIRENQPNFRGHVDGAMAGVSSSNAHNFVINHQAVAYDQLGRENLIEERNAAGKGSLFPSRGKKLLQRHAIENGSSKVVRRSSSGIINKSNMQHLNKPADGLARSNKRKGENVVRDDSNPRKKIRKIFAEHVEGKVKRNKSEDLCIPENFETSAGKVSIRQKSSTFCLPNNTLKKGGMTNSAQKSPVPTGVGNCEIYVKKQNDQIQELQDNEPSLVTKSCNAREVFVKKIKLKRFADRQPPAEVWQNNGNYLQDGKFPIKEETSGGYFHKQKKSRVSLAEDNLKICQADDVSQRKNVIIRLPGGKECLSNRNIIEEEVTKPGVQPLVTTDGVVKIQKDLGEPLSTAATSNSSKISDSCKNRISFRELKESPQESVSSSPVRMAYLNVGRRKKPSCMNGELSEAKKGASGLTNDNGFEIVDSRSKLKAEIDDECYNAHKHEVSITSRAHSVKNASSFGRRDTGKLNCNRRENKSAQRKHDTSEKSSYSCSTTVMQQNHYEDFPKSSTEQISSVMGPLNGELYHEDKQGALCPSKHTAGSNGTDNSIDGEAVQSGALGKKNVRGSNASVALKEAGDVLAKAEELRSHADLVKNSGFSSESNYAYFKAAIKFLHGASLLEVCNEERSESLQMTPMKMYNCAAKLCNKIASEFEKGHEMTAAALAYKCLEVSYMRVVYCRNSTIHHVWHDLQSSLQMIPQDESPSSSASDVDNLNNLVTADKATLAKSSDSHAMNVLLTRKHHDLIHLFDFTKDINSAMEAAKKLQHSYSAAILELEKAQNKEAIIAVKRVIDLSYQNVEEFVHLVELAFNAIIP